MLLLDVSGDWHCFVLGRRASSFTEPSFTVPAHSCPPTLTAFLDAPELPEVIDSLIKRYQSRFL